MWQADDNLFDQRLERPDPWSEIQRRLERRLVGAYCSMRFDGHSRERVMEEQGFTEDEIEEAIRRGAQIYEHDAEDALSWVGLPQADKERRRRSFGDAFHPENRLTRTDDNERGLSGFFTPRDGDDE